MLKYDYINLFLQISILITSDCVAASLFPLISSSKYCYTYPLQYFYFNYLFYDCRSIFSSSNTHPMGQHRNNNTPNNYEYNNHNSHVVGNLARKNVLLSSASSPMHSLMSPLTADISL